jgi:hypothetical protein
LEITLVEIEIYVYCRIYTVESERLYNLQFICSGTCGGYNNSPGNQLNNAFFDKVDPLKILDIV